MDNRLLNIFDLALERTRETLVPVKGWFEQLPNEFQYRLRVESGDLTSYQKYFHEDKYVASIFDFTDAEADTIDKITGIKSTTINGFYIAPNASILPHLDYSPKRSLKTTILNLSGTGSILKLYDDKGNVIFQLPEMIDQYTLFPKHVIHSYDVKYEAARLINIWHE